MSRLNIVNQALSQIGVTEDPPGSNDTPYGKWFGLWGSQLHPNQKEWCGVFQSWNYYYGGHPLGTIDYRLGFASVPFMLKHCRELRRLTTKPLPGDLAIFDWQKESVPETQWSPDHVEMFIAWLIPDKVFLTIAGNVSPTKNSKGGIVLPMVRTMQFLEAFINPLNLPADD